MSENTETPAEDPMIALGDRAACEIIAGLGDLQSNTEVLIMAGLCLAATQHQAANEHPMYLRGVAQAFVRTLHRQRLH